MRGGELAASASGNGVPRTRARSSADAPRMASRSPARNAATRERTGAACSSDCKNCSNAAVRITKPGGTAMPARVSSPRLPPLPPTWGRSCSVTSSNQPMIAFDT